MADLNRLLRRGFFPKELPPAFRSQHYAAALRRAGFAPPFPPAPVAELCTYSLGRAGGVRRTLSMPNPVPHFRLIAELANGWNDIRSKINPPDLSVSKPTLRSTMGRAAAPRESFGGLPGVRVRSRKHGRYLLLADVAEYYPSVYTHSIAWALHEKDFAKQRKNRTNYTLLGPRIDRAVRNTQDQQTNGIPIGPDSSFVLGELILSAVDRELLRLGRTLSAFRYYDDYEFAFERASDAEDFLAGLHGALGMYNLRLNSTKTRIVALPIALDHSWRDGIRRYDLGSSESEIERGLLGYFDLVFHLKTEFPADPLVSYAVSRLESVMFTDRTWSMAQALLLQALSVEPDAIQQVAVAFAQAHSRGRKLDLGELTTGITLALRRHAPQNHGFEVSWALWMALSFGCAIEDREALAALASMSDSVVALLALDAVNRGLMPGINLSHWETLVTGEQTYGPHWLLSYEARVRGWLPTLEGGDHVAADPAFAFLQQAGVNFYTRVRAPTQASIAEIPNWRPAYPDDGLSFGEQLDTDF